MIKAFESDVRESCDFFVEIPCSTYQHRVSGVEETPELKYYHIFPHDKLRGVKHEAYEWVGLGDERNFVIRAAGVRLLSPSQHNITPGLGQNRVKHSLR